MAQFSPALSFTLPHEGGYSNDAADSGGATNYGITEKVARAHGYTGDMRNLPPEVAAQIYAADYWPGLEDLAYQEVANKIFDLRVNMGIHAADKLAQRAANLLVDPPTAEDGLLGPDSTLTINSADPNEYLSTLAQLAIERYQQIAAKNPKNIKFLNGWIARAQDFETVLIDAASDAAAATGEAIQENPMTTGLLALLALGAGLYLFAGRRL
jgi:lysozyme family protein